MNNAIATTAFNRSPKQGRIVNHRGGPRQLIVFVGAENAEAMSCWVTSLFPEDADPYQIIILTFTEQAAQYVESQMTNRLPKPGERCFWTGWGQSTALCHLLAQR
jgi:hypothetical protein